MSEFINNQSEFLVDLPSEQQQVLTGGQTNSTTGRLPGGMGSNPGATIVVPDMLYTVPAVIPTNNLFGNQPSSSPSTPSTSSTSASS